MGRQRLISGELSAENVVMSWKSELVESVWQHARVMPEVDPSVWRQDACGAWIRRDQFGHEHSEFGWKIENVSTGGAEIPENLRPFNVRNGFEVGSNQPHCQTTADRARVPAGEYVSPPRNRGV
jgi:hypothetical protein